MTGNEGLTSALSAVVTWVLVGAIKKWAPATWGAVDSQKLRLFVVAFVAMGVAAVTSLVAGGGAREALRLGLAAFAGAVTMRQATKPKSVKLTPYHEIASIKTVSPDPRGNAFREP